MSIRPVSLSQHLFHQPSLKQVRTHKDMRGNLGFIEWTEIGFKIARVYYFFDIPCCDVMRGVHGHKKLTQFMLCLNGSFDVYLRYKGVDYNFTLSRPDEGLYIPPGTWRSLSNFSERAIGVVLASDVYKEDDYIYEFEEFLKFEQQ